MRKNQQTFFFEVTDTFGGEPNYGWVRRYKVKASSLRGALFQVSRESGYQGRIRPGWDSGDVKRWDVAGAAICVFGSHWDGEYHSQMLYVQTL
jgi:hypothetical protein